MTTFQTASPPDSTRTSSPTIVVQQRHKDKGSYVQRWKVLRDRNRNLPKLDFNVKATVIPKRQQRNHGIGGLTRAYTMDVGTKLPSISTASVITTSTNITNVTGASGGKTQGSGKKTVSIQDSLDIPDKHSEVNLNPSMSKSLPNIANASQQETTKSPKHRYEKIAHSKRLMKRSQEKEATKDGQILEQSGIYQIDLGDMGDENVSSGKLSERKSILSPVNETNSARTRKELENDKIGRRSRRKKWRDNCKCMRCEIMQRQYVEGDRHYSKWGIYPCQQFNRQKYFNHYFYDSD